MLKLRGKYNECKVFTDNVDNETVGQLTALLNQESVKDSQVRIMSDCFTEDIEVLTDSGFKYIRDLNLTDKIANYDLESGVVFFKEPLNIIRRELRENEKVYDLYCKQSNFHITATENHRILTKHGDVLMKDIDTISVLSDYLYFAKGVNDSDICSRYSDDEIRLICWVVGDGCISDNGNGSLRVKFGFKKERKVARLKEVLTSLDLDYSESTEKRGDISIIVTVDSSRYIINLLNGVKEFPKDFIRLNKSQAEIFIDELIKVDGDYTNFIKNGVYRFNSKSKSSIDIAQAIMCLNYNMTQFKSRVYVSNLTGENNYIYYLNKVKSDTVKYSKSGFHNRKIIKSEVSYSGLVYCIECETSYFVARQNGLSFITGNCHAGKGCVIGTTMTLKDKVVPNLVGVDIGCFTGDTEVYMSSGNYKTLKDLYEAGGLHTVCSYDISSKTFKNCNAVAKLTRRDANLVCVRYWIEDEAHSEVEIKCTPDHKFLVKDKNKEIWVEAKDLSRGMYLVNDENDYDIIIYRDTEFLDEKSDVYCLTVDETHTFEILHGVVVHNCGMTAVKLKEKRIDLPKLDSVIRKYVPSGFEVHEEPICNDSPIGGLRCAKYVNLDRAMKSLGTLGSGNHFIEVDKDKEGNLWLVVHTGSRHLGIEVCNYYQDLGYTKLKEKEVGGTLKERSEELIKKLKSEGRDKEISKALSKLREEYHSTHIDVPQALAYVEGKDFEDYLHDMNLVQQHAVANRMTIVRQIIKNMKLHVEDEFTTIHNYIDVEHMILRKGSVSAQKGERLLIPMNMRDGSLICIGKGNKDWNYSAPHGAGRLMSRSQAKESVSMREFKDSMKGIYTTSVNSGTIDESPMAYKPMQEIIDNIGDTVEILDVIKPIYNFKASEE